MLVRQRLSFTLVQIMMIAVTMSVFSLMQSHTSVPWQACLNTHTLYMQHVPSCENKHIFAHLHRFKYYFHVLHLLVFPYSYTVLILFYFMYLFLRRSFSYLYSVSLLYPVTICRRKARFPDRDHLISPSSPHKAPLWASAHCASY